MEIEVNPIFVKNRKTNATAKKIKKKETEGGGRTRAKDGFELNSR